MTGPGCLSYGWVVYTDDGVRRWFPCVSPLPKSRDVVFHAQVMPLVVNLPCGVRVSSYKFVALDDDDNEVELGDGGVVASRRLLSEAP